MSTPKNLIDQPTALLGGLTPRQFMRRHWQKKPLLIRQAVPGGQPVVDRKALFELAQRPEVESRLLIQGRADRPWQLRHGPFTRGQFPALKTPGWTLLVQGVDLHVPAAHELLQRFRFVPDARLDDLMISWASDQGGVGPHHDSYDVFLLQASGRRRWRIGPPADQTLVPDMPVKLLANFQPETEYLLEPGDMLYLPPLWAHDGVAEGSDCMTCSVGFRVPQRGALASDMVQRMADGHDDERLYRDPQQPATDTPARLPAKLQDFAREALSRLLADEQSLHCALGEVLSEPKPRVWFDEPDGPWSAGAVCLDRRTRMLYDERCIYINGESYRAAGRDARLMRELADRRHLDAQAVARASEQARALLQDWYEAGWVVRVRA